MYFNLLSLSIHSFPSLPLSLSSNKSTIYTSTHTHTHTHTHYASYNLLLPFIPSILLLLYCFLSPFSIPLVIYSIPPPLSPPPTMILGAPISFHIYISSICPPHLTLFLLLLLLPFTVDRMVLIPPLRGLLPSCFNSSHSLSFVPSLPPRTSFPHHLQPFTFSLPPSCPASTPPSLSSSSSSLITYGKFPSAFSPSWNDWLPYSPSPSPLCLFGYVLVVIPSSYSTLPRLSSSHLPSPLPSSPSFVPSFCLFPLFWFVTCSLSLSIPPSVSPFPPPLHIEFPLTTG